MTQTYDNNNNDKMSTRYIIWMELGSIDYSS